MPPLNDLQNSVSADGTPLMLDAYALRGCHAEDGFFIFNTTGSHILYTLTGDMAAPYRYLVFEVDNREDYSVCLTTGFWEDSDKNEAGITAFTGILPGVKTTICIPLSTLDGETLFGQRYPGILKTVIKGNKINPARLCAVGIGLPPIHKETTLSIQNARLTCEAEYTTLEDVSQWLDDLGQYKQKDWPGKTHTLEECNQRMQDEWQEAHAFLQTPPNLLHGDRAKTYEATGFFRLEKDNGRYWLVTPEGGRFFSTGSDCIVADIIARYDSAHNEKDFLKQNLQRAYGADWYEKWCDVTHHRLIKMNINTLAVWGDYAFAKRAKIPYTKHLRDFPKTKEYIYRDFPDVFAPEYQLNADIYAQQMYEDLDDPYMLGYFMANEPHWAFVDKLQLGYDLVRNPKDLHTKKHLIAFMREKYHDRLEDLNAEWKTSLTSFSDLHYMGAFPVISPQGMAVLEDFATFMVHEYVRIPAQALKKIDARHLNLGLRYAYVTSDTMFGGSEFFDVYSINCYEHLCDRDVTIAYEKTGKPIMVGEYQFGALDRGLSANGIKAAASNVDRGKAIRRYVEHAASLPGCVGIHYFQWNDQGFLGRGDGENYNIGFVDICNRIHEDAANAYAEANRNVYAVADGLVPPYDEPVNYAPPIFY